MVFKMLDINMAQRAADGRLAWHPTLPWLKGGQQEWGVTVHPVRNCGSTTLLAQHGAGNHA
jgi:hypothetical protein